MSEAANAIKSSEAGTDSAVAIVVAKTSTTEKILRVVVPVAMVLLAIGLWQLHIVVNNVPRYIMPAPADVVGALITDWPTLYPSLLVTVRVTLSALALALIGGVGLKVHHIDSTVLMERPKVSPYKQEMRETLARVLRVQPHHVNVKATRGEGMGPVGRGEGVVAMAIATLVGSPPA